LENAIPLFQKQVRIFGLESKLNLVRAVNISVLELGKDFDSNVKALQKLIEDIKRKTGQEVLYLDVCHKLSFF